MACIVLADDDMMNREILEMYLARCGYTDVHAFNCGKDALDFIQKNVAKIDLILLDKMMPYISGNAVFETLKKDNRSSRIPVIFQTADAYDDHIINDLKSGVFAYITKPYSEESIDRLVKDALEHSASGNPPRK